MKSWFIEGQTGTADLKLVERDIPAISDTQVLVKLTAPGVVPFDQAVVNDENEATFPPAVLPIVPGNQGAGVVEDPGKSNLKKGDRVMFGAFIYGFMAPGSWAEYCAVERDHIGLIPDSVPDGAASQAAVAYPTAYFALKEAGMAPGKTVLATGIGGSVGNAAYQQAKALGAARVFSTAGSTAKAEQARAMGFTDIIDLSKEAIGEHIMRETGGAGVDIIIDSVGGQVIAEAVKAGGRYCKAIVLGFAAGRQSTITLSDLILNRISIQGYGAYTSTPEQWAEAFAFFKAEADKGTIKVIHDKSFKFADAKEALTYMATQRPFGAVSLEM